MSLLIVRRKEGPTITPRQRFEGHPFGRGSYTSARRRTDNDLFMGRLAAGMELEEWETDMR